MGRISNHTNAFIRVPYPVLYTQAILHAVVLPSLPVIRPGAFRFPVGPLQWTFTSIGAMRRQAFRLLSFGISSLDLPPTMYCIVDLGFARQRSIHRSREAQRWPGRSSPFHRSPPPIPLWSAGGLPFTSNDANLIQHFSPTPIRRRGWSRGMEECDRIFLLSFLVCC